MQFDVRLEQSESCPLPVVRRRAEFHELSKVVPEACGLVWNVLRAQRVTGAGRHVAIYWDDDINLEVGVELDAPFAGHGELVGSTIPAGPVATATHYRPYNELHHAHVAIQAWCKKNGHTPAGSNWEIYGHWEDEWKRDPSQIVTDVFYLLVDEHIQPNGG